MNREILNKLAIEKQRTCDGIQSMREIQRSMRQKLKDALELAHQCHVKLKQQCKQKTGDQNERRHDVQDRNGALHYRLARRGNRRRATTPEVYEY